MSDKNVFRVLKKVVLPVLAVLLLFAAAPGAVTASEPGSGDGWEFGVGIYLWGADIGGKTATGSDIDVGFDDLLDNLQMAFMGSFGVRKGRWGFMADAIYMDVGKDSSFTTSVSGANIEVDANLDMKTWILTPAVTYTAVENEKVRLDVLGGARYLSMDMTLDIDFGPPLSTHGKIDRSDDAWDAVVGVKGALALTQKWHVPYYLDIGTGDSDLTWQAMAGIGYTFSKFFEVVATYRYLDWEFDDSSAVDSLNISGPLVGIKFSF